MFIALGLTFLGMAVGYLLRRSPWPGRLTRGITPVIMLLLLGLGMAVGGNAALMEALPDKPVMHDNSREPETTFGGGPRQSL